MDNLLGAILPQDFADIGMLLHGVCVLSGENAGPADVIVSLLLSLLVSLSNIDEFFLADLLLEGSAIPFDMFDGFLQDLELELGVGEWAPNTPDDAMLILIWQVIRNMFHYASNSWEAVRQAVGAQFDEDDDTFAYVLAWVTVLYLKNMVELNTEETEANLAKANGAVSKQTRPENTSANEKLFDLNTVETALKFFRLDKFEGNVVELDAEDLAATFDLSESEYVLQELLEPLQDRLIEMKRANEEDSGLGAVVTVMSAVSSSSSGGCGTKPPAFANNYLHPMKTTAYKSVTGLRAFGAIRIDADGGLDIRSHAGIDFRINNNSNADVYAATAGIANV